MSEIRLSMVVKLFPPWIGGLEAHAAQLSAAVVKVGGFRVNVITGQPSRAAASFEQWRGVHVQRAATLCRLARTPISLGLARLLRQNAPDVVHYHTPFPWGELTLPPRGVPVVVTYYHDVVRQRFLCRLYRPVLERLLQRADVIVAWSRALIDQSPILPTFRSKITVSPGGLDTRRFTPTAASRSVASALRARICPDGPLVLFVGRLVYYKGVDVLLRAMCRVNAALVIVGSGPERARLAALAASLGIEQRVRFAGEIGDEELPLYYQASDLLVLPSIASTETFGLVQVEAHASGIPSICTALPTGVATVNEHQRTGLVVPPNSPGELGEAIRCLISSDAWRRQLGAHAQQRAVERFDIHRCATDMAAIYRGLVSGVKA